jgi:hypothetical protein
VNLARILAVGFACVLPLRALAGAGVAGADILKIPVEARGWGLANAYSAIADDVGAMAYNPAGVARSGEREVRFTYLRMLEGSSYESLLGAYPLGRWGSVGLMFVWRQVPTIDNGSLVLGETTPISVSDGITGVFVSARFSHLMPSVRFASPFSFGLGIKSVTQHIGGFSASSTAVDLGLRATYDLFRLALVLQNMGGGVTFPGTIVQESDALPQTLREAIAFVPFEDSSASLTLAIENASYVGVSSQQKFGNEVRNATESLDLLSYGAEYWRLKKMGVRLGYLQPYGEGAKTYSGARGLSVGVSFRVFARLVAYQLDIAYRPFALGSDKQDAGTVSLGLRF